MKADVVSLEVLFKDQYPRFLVPEYQRGFEWRATEQVEEFWLDLMNLVTNQDDTLTHFFGVIVIQEPRRGDEKWHVVDGQQRLVVTLMVLAHLRNMYSDYRDSEFNQKTLDMLLRARRMENAAPSHLLELKGMDADFFRCEVIEGNEFKRKQGAPPLMRRAWNDLRERLESWCKSSADLARVQEALLNRFRVIRLLAQREDDPYLVFEVLNARGLELGSSDLLRNYIFRRAESHSAKDYETVLEKWRLAQERIDAAVRRTDSRVNVREEMDHFIRRFWMSTRGFVRQRRLFQSIRKQLDEENVKAFSSEVAREAQHYFHLLKPDGQYWRDRTIPEILTAILHEMGAKQCLPLLLAVAAKHDESDVLKSGHVVKLLKLVEVLTFRYSIVCKKSPNALEGKYDCWARRIRGAGTGVGISSVLEGDAGVYAELCQLIPDDAETKSHFMEMEPTAREARYLLRRIEEAKRSLLGQDELRPDRSLTLEHVLPQDPSSWNDQPGWERISEREHARLVGLPGNLTLLTGRRNKQLQNSPFRRKRSMYEKSELQITKDIASHDVWTESQIRSRTKDLLTLALKVWRKG